MVQQSEALYNFKYSINSYREVSISMYELTATPKY